MAVQQGYGKMAGANSLVFAYDTGDTVNSFKGEPTENMITGNMNTSGAASLGSDAGGDYVQLGNNTSGYCAIVVPNIYIPSGVTYTWSFELKSSETFTSNFSWDTNEYSDQYPNSNDDSRLTYNHSTPTMVADEWTQYRLTVVMKDGLTNARSGDFFRFFFPTFQNKKIYYRNVQFELKDHITAYAGLGGTRSATEGLLDLTGNQTIDLSSTSFDANAQPVLDGTEEYKDLGSDQVIKTSGGWTVESVVYYNSVAGGYDNYISPANFTGSDSTSYNSWYWSVLNNKLALWNINPGVWKYGSTTIQANTWYHTVLTCSDDGTSYQMYLNGVAEGGNHTTYSWNPSYSGLKVRYIGAGRPNLRFINGEVPVTKIYDKALTAAEVQANFNNYKTRFNIS